MVKGDDGHRGRCTEETMDKGDRAQGRLCAAEIIVKGDLAQSQGHYGKRKL